MNKQIGHSVHTQSATERIYVGEPASQAIATEMGRTGTRRAFVIGSRTLATQTAEIERLREALGPLFVGTFAEIPAHGTRSAVLAAAGAARAAGADVLVAIGGGSIIDATKIVSLCLRHGLTAPDELEPYRMGLDAQGRRTRPVFDGPEVRVIAVPTTLSGAEFNETAGTTDERSHRKEGYAHRLMVPRAIVLDPSITRHTPAWLWLSTGVRAVDHAVETLGSLLSNPYCDSLADSALRNLVDAIPRTAAEPDDEDARLRCLVGVWQAMTPMAAGVPMGISHATGHVLGGSFGVAHGHTSCVTAPQSLAFNAGANGHRQHAISAALGDERAPACELLDRFIRGLGMPRTLGEVGMSQTDLPKLAEGVMRDAWTHTNPRPIADAGQALEFLATLL
ncbi:MAG: iron-containing alcohol dehydrogenase [Pseudomonadota bacterium]